MSDILTSLGTGLTSFLPNLIQMLVTGIQSLFFVAGESGAVTGLTAFGQLTLASIVVTMSIMLIRWIMNVCSMKFGKGKKQAA